jgi:hypothetical protein
MSKQVLALSALLPCATAANAQYDTLWIGEPDGMSTDQYNTPFANVLGQAGKTHYLFSSADLIDAGLEPDMAIRGLCLTVVDDDIQDPACLMDIHLGLKNSVQTGYDTQDEFDLGYNMLADTMDVTLGDGTLCFTSPGPFYFSWLDVYGIAVELTFERGDEPGLAPRVLLRTGLPHDVTMSATVMFPFVGANIFMNMSGADGGFDNSLPAIGLIVDAPTGMKQRERGCRIGLSPNPAGASLNIQAPSGTCSIRILDMCGRTVLQQTLTSTVGKMDVASLPNGCYVVKALSPEGTLASGRFIKE